MDRQRDTVPVDRRIARHAEAQHGVVAHHQLVADGLGRGAIAYRLEVGRLHALHRGVYAVGHRRVSREGHWLAAVLACGQRAVLSHTSAAALWGLRGSSGARVHVTVPTGAGVRQRDAVVVHRSRNMPVHEAARHDAIPVTTPARTLLDLAGMIAPGPLERAAEQALALRLFDLRAIESVLRANPTRAGARALAAIVARLHDEPQLTRSQLEARFLDLCDAHAIRRPSVNSHVEGFEVDFSWRAQRLVVETDSHRHHGNRAAFERDRAKDAQLSVAGHRVVRFTYRQIVSEPAAVARTLRALLGRA